MILLIIMIVIVDSNVSLQPHGDLFYCRLAVSCTSQNYPLEESFYDPPFGMTLNVKHVVLWVRSSDNAMDHGDIDNGKATTTTPAPTNTTT
jgi:hypothetical protein